MRLTLPAQRFAGLGKAKTDGAGPPRRTRQLQAAVQPVGGALKAGHARVAVTDIAGQGDGTPHLPGLHRPLKGLGKEVCAQQEVTCQAGLEPSVVGQRSAHIGVQAIERFGQ